MKRWLILLLIPAIVWFATAPEDYRQPRLIASALAEGSPARIEAFKASGAIYDGEKINVELPARFHLTNRGGSDGAGLCVFASITHAGVWHNDPVAVKMFEFMFRYPGGGWPEKVDRIFAMCAREMGRPVPEYIQHTGGDMDFLRLALKTGRYPCVTYDGRDGVYYRGRIAHMVNLVYLSDKYAVIHDNNYPGKYLWMSPSEFESRWKGNGGGWAVVLLSPGRPPVLTDSLEDEFESPEVVDHGFRWVADESEVGWFYLYQNDKHVGTYGPGEHGFKWKKGGQWFAGNAPIALPLSNYGVDVSRIPSDGRDYYTRNGRQCARNEALAALYGGNTLTDDSKSLRIVFVGDEKTRTKFMKDWLDNPRFARFKDKFILQVFDPSDWQVAGYPRGLSIVRPGAAPSDKGEVLKNVGDLPELELLIKLLDWAINPTQPDPTQPQPDNQPAPASDNRTWLVALAAFLTLLIFGKRKETK